MKAGGDGSVPAAFTRRLKPVVMAAFSLFKSAWQKEALDGLHECTIPKDMFRYWIISVTVVIPPFQGGDDIIPRKYPHSGYFLVRPNVLNFPGPPRIRGPLIYNYIQRGRPTGA